MQIDSIGKKLSPLQITWEFTYVLRELKSQNPVGPSFFFLGSGDFIYTLQREGIQDVFLIIFGLP